MSDRTYLVYFNFFDRLVAEINIYRRKCLFGSYVALQSPRYSFMIRVAVQDCLGTVELFEQQQSSHVMGQHKVAHL